MNPAMTPTPIVEIQTSVNGGIGLITMNRPKALNALTLPMVRALLATLLAWRDDPAVLAVAIRGSNKVGRPGSPEALFGNFCAGGDIRFLHQAALAGDRSLEAFFTEEYTLNHLIHSYPKPYIAFMDGTVMGGGMGVSQGAALRIVTEHTKMAMPETGIGLFPDVGGGYFLSRCPGHVGEYLALTGQVIGGKQAVAWGLADTCVVAHSLPALWAELQTLGTTTAILDFIESKKIANNSMDTRADAHFSFEFDAIFGLDRVVTMVARLEALGTQPARAVAATLRQRSPLMLYVTLEQVRRARTMSLADDLRMERDLVQHCFYTAHLGRSGASSETVEGIRALVIDKDYKPVWNPARMDGVSPEMLAPFFVSPWTADQHPLRGLA